MNQKKKKKKLTTFLFSLAAGEWRCLKVVRRTHPCCNAFSIWTCPRREYEVPPLRRYRTNHSPLAALPVNHSSELASITRDKRFVKTTARRNGTAVCALGPVTVMARREGDSWLQSIPRGETAETTENEDAVSTPLMAPMRDGPTMVVDGRRMGRPKRMRGWRILMTRRGLRKRGLWGRTDEGRRNDGKCQI